MFAAASASMDFALACAPVLVAPCSSDGAPRAVTDSPRSGRPFVSLRNLDIRRVRRIGSRRRVGGIVIFDAPGDPGPPRIAVTAGKQVGGAVRRNRAKRRMREAVAQAPIRSGREYVLVATPAVVDTPFEELTAWVRAAVDVEDER